MPKPWSLDRFFSGNKHIFTDFFFRWIHETPGANEKTRNFTKSRWSIHHETSLIDRCLKFSLAGTAGRFFPARLGNSNLISRSDDAILLRIHRSDPYMLKKKHRPRRKNKMHGNKLQQSIANVTSISRPWWVEMLQLVRLAPICQSGCETACMHACLAGTQDRSIIGEPCMHKYTFFCQLTSCHELSIHAIGGFEIPSMPLRSTYGAPGKLIACAVQRSQSICKLDFGSVWYTSLVQKKNCLEH